MNLLGCTRGGKGIYRSGDREEFGNIKAVDTHERVDETHEIAESLRRSNEPIKSYFREKHWREAHPGQMLAMTIL